MVKKIHVLAFIGAVALILLNACGKDSETAVSPETFIGYWKVEGQTTHWVVGKTKLIADYNISSVRSGIVITTISDYKLDGKTLQLGGFVRSMPEKYEITQQEEHISLKKKSTGDVKTLVRMTDDEVRAAVTERYVGKSDELITALLSGRF